MGRRSLMVGAACLVAAICTPTSAATSQPSFGPQREAATLSFDSSALDLTNADFTGDGIQDVLVLRGRWASPDDYPISILAGNGASGFSDKAPQLFGGSVPRAVWPRQALIADYNGDTRPDIFIGDSGLDQPPFPGHTNHLALSTADGGYVDASDHLPPGAAYFHSGATADVDADGDRDIFLADLGTPIRLLLNDGTGHFTTASGRFPASVLTFGHERYTRSALVDVDGNGAPDVVMLAEEHNPSSAVLLNDGHGFFTERANALPPKPFGTDAIGLAIQPLELNGDGHPDLILGYTKGNPWYVGRWLQIAVNNGDGTFRDETATRLPQSDNNASWPYEIVLGDLNSDGAVDFGVDLGNSFCTPFCPEGRDTSAPLYLNRGDGSFERLPASAFAQPPAPQLRLIDVNGDGALDVFGLSQAYGTAPERYVVQRQGDSGDGPGGGIVIEPAPDDDGDGVPNSADRCPALAGRSANGCPGATLGTAGAVRTLKSGKRGIRLNTGTQALCPPAGIACRGTVDVKTVPPKPKKGKRAPKSIRLGSAAYRVASGKGSVVSLNLSSRGVAVLRKAKKLKVRIDVALAGPDTLGVKRTQIATIRPPRR